MAGPGENCRPTRRHFVAVAKMSPGAICRQFVTSRKSSDAAYLSGMAMIRPLESYTYILPLTISAYLYWNFYGGLRKTVLFLQEWRFGRSRSSNVIDFGVNRKRVGDFLLVRHSNLGPILHRFRDIAGFLNPTPIPP